MGRCLQREAKGSHLVAGFGFVEGGGGDVGALVAHENLGFLAGRGEAVGIVHLIDERRKGAVIGYGGKAGLGLRKGKTGDVSRV